MAEHRHSSHTVSRLTAHLVWVTKYRYHVLKGEKYLVYADSTAVEGTQEKSLAVLFMCNRTTLLADASDDLKKLEAIRKPTFSFNQRRYRLNHSALKVQRLY